MTDELVNISGSSLTKLEGKVPPGEFLQFLRENIMLEDLIQSRKAQAAIARIMSHYFSTDREVVAHDKERGRLQEINPNPSLELKSGSATSFIHDAFRLKDSQYYYYFPDWNPGDDVPPYLRPEDVVPSKTFSQTFPAKVRQSIIQDLHITEKQFRNLVYVQDIRVTDHAVMKDIPFNKAFCRVAISGGEAERYNYNNQEWEPNGDGKFVPSTIQKIKTRLQGVTNQKTGWHFD